MFARERERDEGLPESRFVSEDSAPELGDRVAETSQGFTLMPFEYHRSEANVGVIAVAQHGPGDRVQHRG
jgi:hypothetical protein